MNKKKQFVTPKVVQQVQICLEKDLLVGPSQTVTASSMGQPVDYFEVDGEGDDAITVDWEY